jgi:hypothetical protein
VGNSDKYELPNCRLGFPRGDPFLFTINQSKWRTAKRTHHIGMARMTSIARISWRGTLDTYDPEQVARMRQINVEGVIHATRAVMGASPTPAMPRRLWHGRCPLVRRCDPSLRGQQNAPPCLASRPRHGRGASGRFERSQAYRVHSDVVRTKLHRKAPS